MMKATGRSDGNWESIDLNLEETRKGIDHLSTERGPARHSLLLLYFQKGGNMTEAEKDFEEYVKRYSKSYNLKPEEAKQHQLVKDVKAYYEEIYANRTIPPGLPDGSC